MLPKLHVGMGTAVGFHEAAAGPSDTQSRLCDGSRITSNPRDMRVIVQILKSNEDIKYK